MGTAVKADLDFAIRYGDVGRNVDQIAKDLTGLGIEIAAHCLGENSIDPTGENQKDHVEIDLQSDGGRERIHVKEAHGIGERVFDEHALSVASAGAPAIDFLSPDIYVANFTEWCAWYTQSGNLLFIPESRGDARGVANGICAIGRHDAIGCSPFGLDRTAGPDTELARACAVSSQVAELILKNQGKGTMTVVVLEKEDPVPKLRLGNYILRGRYSTRSFGPPVTPLERVASLFIAAGPGDYVIVGRDMNVYFAAASDDSVSAGLGRVEKETYVNGRWVVGRRLNGDETPEWKALRYPGDRYSIQRVKLYRCP